MVKIPELPSWMNWYGVIGPSWLSTYDLTKCCDWDFPLSGNVIKIVLAAGSAAYWSGLSSETVSLFSSYSNLNLYVPSLPVVVVAA